MKLKLNRPIAFVDLETTGVDIQNDRIVQIAITKLMPDLTRITKTKLVNPEMSIPKLSSDIHGITDNLVLNEPTFKQIAKGIVQFIQGCDLGGFNSNVFDFPLLNNEFQRAGISFDFSQVYMIDVGNIFKIQNPRTLSAAYKRYTGNELDGAHDAGIDINATVDVFLKQMEEHEDIPQTVDEIDFYSNYKRKRADLSGKFYYDESGNLRFNFGKHKDQIASDFPDFLTWMVFKANFPLDTHLIAQHILNTL